MLFRSGEIAQELPDWWTEFQDANIERRDDMLVADAAPKKKRRRVRGKPNTSVGADATIPESGE